MPKTTPPSPDKPSVLASLAAINKEAAAFERPPARIALTDGKFITFPDPMEMDAFESDELIRVLLYEDSRPALQRWLSEEDFQAVADAGLTRREMRTLVKKVTAYYEDVFGSPGESAASDS